MEIASNEFHRIVKERDRAEGKLAKEKSTAEEFAAKAMVGGAAALTGFGLGVLNAQQSATLEAPYQVGGQVPVDALAAGLGAVAILATPTTGANEKFMPVALGFGAAGIGIWAQRAGFAWEQARMGTAPAATTTPASTTTAGSWPGHSLGGRYAPPGVYGGGSNPYVHAYGR